MLDGRDAGTSPLANHRAQISGADRIIARRNGDAGLEIAADEFDADACARRTDGQAHGLAGVNPDPFDSDRPLYRMLDIMSHSNISDPGRSVKPCRGGLL